MGRLGKQSEGEVLRGHGAWTQTDSRGNSELGADRGLDGQVSRQTGRRTMIAASMALLLGVVGIYGVISYVVSQRRREIGIRAALGARRGALKRSFVRHGLVLAGVGVAIGLGAAAGLTRLMSTLLYGITPLDPLTY